MIQTDIRKDFAKYVSLNVIGMIGLSCYILADTFFIAKALGSQGLAALNFTLPIYNLINGIGMMIGIGGGTRYTICHSQNENQQAGTVFTHCITTAVFVGLCFSIMGLFFSAPIASLLGADADVLDISNIYLKTILTFTPFFMCNNIVLSFVRNDGNPRLAMAAMLIGSFSNIILDYVFMFPMGMGMFGAAFATGLAPIISITVLSLHFFKHESHFALKKCKFAFSELQKILTLGVSSFITELSSGIVLLTFNLVILRIEGNTGVAAYGVIANIALVVIAMFTGISQGTQPLLSRSFGLNEHGNTFRILRYAISTSLVISFAIYTISLCFTDSIIAVFNSDNDMALHDLATRGILLYFAGFFFAGINVITAAFFSAVSTPTPAFSISILRGFALVVPMIFTLSFLFGMDGVWLSFTCTELLTSVVSLGLLFRHHKTVHGQMVD